MKQLQNIVIPECFCRGSLLKTWIPAFAGMTVMFFALSSPAFANNLVISNVTLEDRNPTSNTMVVQFNISWDHSWRKNDGRHDAVWVFVKILQNSTDPWVHGKLYTAGTNPTDTSPGTNSDLKIVIPTDKIGAFLERTATGNGTFESQKVRLNIDYGNSGIGDTDTVQVQVHGIEMVYIPEGPFYVGEGTNSNADEVGPGIFQGVDSFISEFNSSGTFQWSKRLGGTSTDYSTSVTTDTANNVIVSGVVSGKADLNGNGTTSDTNENGNTGVYASGDGFISVFNSAGTLQWSKRLGGTGNDFGYSVTADTASNVIVAGYVNGNADLNGDGDTADTNETGNTGVYAGQDAFVSVFNSAGTFQWSKRLGGTSTDWGYSVATDTANDVIVSGYVTGKADLNGDGDTADANENGNTGVYAGQDAFVSVFNSAGTFQWSKRLGGTSTDNAYSVKADNAFNVIVTGYVTGSADLNGDGDTADANETGNTGVYGDTDVFLSVFNSAGTFQWSKRLGGTFSDYGLSVTNDTANNVIVTGQVYTNADLNGNGTTSDLSAWEQGNTYIFFGAYGGYDIFLSKFDSAGTFQWSHRLGGTSADYGYSVTTDSANNVLVTGGVNGWVDINGNGSFYDSDPNELPSSVYQSSDIFISKFNSSGTFQWDKRLGGTSNNDYGLGIKTDTSGNVFVTGQIQGNVDLNNDGAIISTLGLYQVGYDNTAAQITTTGISISSRNSADDIYTTPVTVTGLAGVTGNSSWPNGYGAFYMMKYEITQEQYKNFLNDLSRVQQGNRVGATVSGNTVTNYYVMSNGTSVSARNGIRAPASGNGTSPTAVVFGNDLNGNGTFNETDDGQSVSMNWINWPDLCAYADWAGLRPMTEMEFEKAAHGPNSPAFEEYAWGNGTITQVSSIVNSGRSNETAGNSGNGIAVYNSNASVQGPLRTGFSATNLTNRIAAGAGYYGNMNLSDNVTERAVTLGNSTGRAFTATHGDGTLTTTASYEGNATNNDWPGIDATSARGVTAGTGGGWRGGNWNDSTVSALNSSQYAYIADRNNATNGAITRDNKGGGRLVRTAP